VAVVGRTADELLRKTDLLTAMKTFSMIPFLALLKRSLCAARIQRMLLLLACAAPSNLPAADTAKTFASPEEAVAALVAAAATQDTNALREIFGPAAVEIANPDPVQGANERSMFTRLLKQETTIQRKSDSRCVLVAGENHWPFPIPIVKQDGRWFFDTEAGKEEILNRRIGRNELATLQVLRSCAEAQREYAAHDHDGDEVLEFAQKFIRSPGTKDGLYWPPGPDAEISPLGPLVANAQDLGYGNASLDPKPSAEPFHGYFFKILTRQGKHAPAGKYNYIINGHMIAGFAFVAWPASYGQSGIMTFIVNHQGRVYQKDLGPTTAKAVRDMKEYDPDPTWQPSPD
jgi:hypothetical protein